MTNENNTDYNKKYMDLLKLLPQPYQSDVNISLFNNLFNRFLTKQEIDKISGYIGKGNPNALISRQIKETTVHRQAFQLQPILYDKIGSIEHMASWKDIQNELERLGIDIEDLPNWGAVQKFNWVPPIDINKLINYQDYYWTGSSRPQYITIRSRCAVATTLLNFWDGLITQYGSTMSVVNILPADDVGSLPIYSVAMIDSNVNLIVVAGDATANLSSGDFFDITGTISNNGTYTVAAVPTYNGTTNLTTIAVTGFPNPTIPSETIGTLKLRRFDKIVLRANNTVPNGDYTRLMGAGLLLFLRNFPNTELNNTFVKIVKSENNNNNFTTVVTIDFAVTDNTFTSVGSPQVTGEASLEEQRTIFEANKKCQCDELGGWDDTLWDDNPFIPLWDDTSPADGISDHKNLIDSITNNGPPSLPPASDPPLWYDNIANRLYEYDLVLGWVVIWNNFSLILDATKGFALWDLTLGCDTKPRIESADQWIKQNKWLHKNSIVNFASVKRAIQPIIEYDWDLELNEWTYTDYRWSYRNENDREFVETDATPPLIEIEPITWWEVDPSDLTGKTIILDSRYGDQTDWFTSTKKLYLGDDNVINVYEIDYSEYKIFPTGYPYRTYVTFTAPILLGSPGGSTGNLSLFKPNTQSISPFETINGDVWLGYGVHWLFLGAKDAVPVPHQVNNPFIEITKGAVPIQYPIGGSPAQILYEYTFSAYSQNYLVIEPAGTNRFYLSNDIPVGETRSLRHKALYGSDDIRVYTSNLIGGDSVRQFGTYEEIGEATVNVLNVFNNEFVVPTGIATYFVPGDKIELYGNTNVGTMTFTVAGGSPPAHDPINKPNRIVVEDIGSPSVMQTVAGNGEIRNLTNPMRTDLSGFNLTNTNDITIYVTGIKFLTNIAAQLNVTIEVGPANIEEIGRHHNMVRTIEDNNSFDVLGSTAISRIQYRRVEQVKTKDNQYPLFDIFKVDGSPAFRANPIFGYKTSPESDINLTGLRIVFNSTDNIYEFDQFLLDENNGELFAYRDYENKEEDHWYNPETKEVFFWKDVEWSDKTEMSNHYRRAVVTALEPASRLRDIDGLYWYNTTLDKLFRRFINPVTNVGSWIEVSPIDRYLTDINLQTIWKPGKNDEEYIPKKVDWKRRAKEEYDVEQQDYVIPRTEELIIEDPSLSEAQATAIATIEWYKTESNELSPTGIWLGDWEIPDPLYFNNQHENRKHLTSRELLTHFVTIIDAQETIPGYSGSKDGMFNLIPMDEVNYGAGGTIKEFNDGFDTMLSSTFVNNVTPRSLIEFAHDQYETQLNFIKELYRKNSIELFTNLDIENILDISSYISNEIILKYELNDQSAFIYGDTTTFTDVDGVNDLGVRNWIATLPYVNLVEKKVPERLIDDKLLLNEVVHHDGHRNEYFLAKAVSDIVSQLILRAPDPRTGDDIGRSASNLPPNNISEFNASFNSISNREGVYWYYVNVSSPNILYRYIVAESGVNTPATIYEDGTLWMDLTPGSEVLRIKNTDFQGTITWNVVDGLVIGDQRLHNGTDPTDVTTATVSVWQVINLDMILGDIIFNLENKLYENVPKFPKLAYDFDKLVIENPTKYSQYLEEAFLDYISQSEINTPYLNSGFSATNPFTWNYLRSAQGGGTVILEADGLTNSFLVAGNKVPTFDPCSDMGACPSSISFYVKNSDVNNGTWLTLTSTPSNPTTFYNALDNTTRIFVEGDVLDSQKGIIYSGVLPSLKTQTFPFNLNNGSESGGDWRDLYRKVYGTPYPHKEPWVLQGYFDKPDWWDIEYLNDDINQWGNRTWKYKHGLNIVAAYNDAAVTYGTFEIAGNFNTSFISTSSFGVDNSIDHTGTYVVGSREIINTVNIGAAGSASIEITDVSGLAPMTYLPKMLLSIVEPVNNTIVKTYTVNNVNHSGTISTITVEETIAIGDITTVDYINGSLYNPTTNKSQVKITSLVSSTSASGRITKAIGMWENIRTGNIPPGRYYPNGVVSITGNPALDVVNGLSINDLPIFEYFSVNINNESVTTDGGITVYEPDEIFPPFWDYIIVFTNTPVAFDAIIRSLYFDFSTEIISPNANYVFGDSGPVEWDWRESSQFLYDQLTVAYRIDPVKYVSSTFGFDYTKIGKLQADRDTSNTPSHTRTNFHGDIVNDKQIIVSGLNQWYVNFNRYSGYDANFSDFRQLWTGWTAPLMYQFASFVDTPSLSVNHRFVNISNFDYEITSKRAPGVEDFWVDAFKIAIINIPPNITRYDNQLDWRFVLKTNINSSRNIKYYDVHNYQFHADETTDECSLFTWEILSVDTFNKIFNIKGDQIYVFGAGRQFDIINSTGNDGTYDVITSIYDVITNTTSILVENVIPTPATDGLIKANYRTIPWKTGDGVYLSTSETLPIPLLGDTVNGTTRYFIIKTSDTTFKISDSKQDTSTNTFINLTSNGTGDHFVGEILSTFLTNNTFNSDTNWRYYTLDKSNVLEFNTPHEVQGMQTLVNIINGYDVYSADHGWKINGDKSELDPATGIIVSWQVEMERFINYAYTRRVIREQISDRYFVTVDDTTNTWTFIEDNKTFITADPVSVFSSNGIYPTPISQNLVYYIIRDTLTTFRIAATKKDAQDGIAIDILSIVGVGTLSVNVPKEISTRIPDFEINPFRNKIWIQPKRGIISNILTGPSEDIRTTQLIFDQDGNRLTPDKIRVYRQDKETKISVVDSRQMDALPINVSPYNLIHLGGLHLFVDAYEHVMKLNNYTSEGNLLYDPFIGLNVTKYEMLFNRQPIFTHRPNVGGYYLETFFNQGANIKENFEAGVENLRYAYDTYNVLESNPLVKAGRDSLGYDGVTDYLSNLNLSEKSQFLFWRGQIQAKGSINAVKAFINSRRFIDAKIDDFWAVKIAEFGSMGEIEFPEMYVATIDSRSNELRLEFIDNDALDSSVEQSFTPIKMSDQSRWYNQPDQVRLLRDNGKSMYFDLKITNNVIANIPGDIINNNGKLFVKHDLVADAVQVTQNNVELLNEEYNSPGGSPTAQYRVINSNIIEIIDLNVIAAATPLTIWGMIFKDDAQNPSRIIDRKSETQISPIQFWDPARGKHYSSAIHNVDLQNTIDPAEYTDTPKVAAQNTWSRSFIGVSWLNTENLAYVPYYSEKMLPDITERFRSWGQLADWSNIVIYEWVESDVPPSEWDAIAQTEEGDRTIPESIRKSGVARKILFEKDNGSPQTWIPLVNKFNEQYVAIDSTYSVPNYSFDVALSTFKATGSPLQYLVDVYINGRFRETVSIIASGSPAITGTYVINDSDIKEADIIRFVQPVPTDQTVINNEIAAGNMLQEYEFTQVPFYDELGNLNLKYYFWVGNKGTKPSGRNRTMSILGAQVQLASMPAAHMFMQNIKPATTVSTDDIVANRIERFNNVGSPPTVSLELNIASGTTVLVELDGVNLIEDDISYIADGTSNTVSILVSLIGVETVKVTYIGVVSNRTIDLPYRFTQVIIRGLQGIVTADRRYTIRYTRNFTLRDRLDVEDKAIGNIDLKNHHEEWKIFRREQQFNIDRWQWDKITESIVGYLLNAPDVRVPSYERELYDEKYGTDTQYGLGENQTFVNGALALASIMAYLIDPDVDFTPIDINVFFANNSLDTNENIIKAMDEIYNTFTFTNVNRMYFSVLHDAFTTKAKYSEIFKTSMISLHGIRPFQTAGIFDD